MKQKHIYSSSRKATKAKPRMHNTTWNMLESTYLHEKQSKETKQARHHLTLNINNLENSSTKGRLKMHKR